MQLFEDLERSMNPADEVGSASGPVGVVGGPSGPSDLRDDDLVSGASSPAGSPRPGGGGSLSGANPSSLGGGLMHRMPGRSSSRTGMPKAISSASLMAMESLRIEPEIWTVRTCLLPCASRTRRLPMHNPCLLPSPPNRP